MLVRMLRKRLQLSMAESKLSPRGLVDLIEARPLAAPFISKLPLAAGEPVAEFETLIISDELIHFRAAGRPRQLLVCFTDKHWGLFMPVPKFLQLLGDDRFDVVMVHDRRRGRHRIGLEGLTGSLWENCALIASRIDLGSYDSLTTYGASMGGFAALRAGLLLKARKAVGIGGSFSNHLGWFRETSGFLPAFDEICACADPGSTVYELYFSTNSHDDRTNADMLARVLPGLRLYGCETRKHNIFPELDDLGRTRAFVHAILGGTAPIDLADFYGESA